MESNKKTLYEFSNLKSFLYIWLPIILISSFHYLSPHSLHWTHDILRRLYYIPIIIAGFYRGFFYSIMVTTVVTIVYLPHAFMEMFNMDPDGSLNKTLEIILYFIIAYITSKSSEKIKKENKRYQDTSRILKDKLEEVMRLEEQLIQSGKLEAIGQLSAGFAHEIKNPLSSIQATNELIEDECIDNKDVKEFIDIQKKELNRLKELLDQFLNFAKPSAIENEPLNLIELLDNLMKLIKTQKKYGISFINNLDNNNLKIRGDSKKLYQVFLNLVLNAIESIDKDGKVDIILENDDKYLIVKIKDDGEGIEKEHLSQIFNPFFTTKEKGTGLGLSIAFKIIEQHKGRIKVNSKRNEGTEFIIKFPII